MKDKLYMCGQCGATGTDSEAIANGVCCKNICTHTWIPVERIDLPAGTGYITNVRKLYCPNCQSFHTLDWDKREEPLEEEDE